MTRLLARRLLAAIPTLLGVLTLVFVLVESAPGDPAANLLGGDRPVPKEVRARIVAAYGLDRPPVERYLRWLGAVALRGELGWSISRGRPVTRVLGDALPATLLLAGAALLVHLAAGTALGVAMARWRGRWPDRALGALGLVLYSMPAFWVGLMAILALSLGLGLFPPGATHSVGAETWAPLRRALDLAWHLALPAGILGLTSAAALSRFVRSGILATLGEEFVRAARARGVGGSRLLLGHALRSALLPAITLLGLSLPVLVSGSLVTEVVFAWPGMGRLAFEAILARDVPVVLAATLLSAVLVIAGNVAADLAMAAADPRIRTGRTGSGR
jgi:peptide/nickel transport system permease protein